MKRLIVLVMVFVFAAGYAAICYSQPATEDLTNVQDAQGKGDKRKGIFANKIIYVTPKEFASLDEGGKAAWREMHQMEFKKRVGVYLAVGAALAIGIAVLGGAFAQGKVAAAAMEGIARNPEASSKIFTPLIISLALIESLVIYSLVIAFMLQSKL